MIQKCLYNPNEPRCVSKPTINICNYSTYVCAFLYVGKDRNFWTMAWFTAIAPIQLNVLPTTTFQNESLSKGDTLILE